MFRQVHLFGVLVFILGFTGSAWGQNFSDVVIFGDSLSDSGNVGRFTTNPDPVWSERVAQAFGASDRNSFDGGSNYAFAGACVNPDQNAYCNSDKIFPVPRVPEQITLSLSQSGGSADPNALYAIWGGVNDVADSAENDPLNAARHTVVAAGVNVAQIRRLQDAGARHVLAFNMPDISKSPYASSLDPIAQGALAQLVTVYNRALHDGISESEEGIVPINVFALFNEIVENPGTYGISNVRGTACNDPNNPGANAANSFTCGPEGLGYPVTYEAGANEQYLFADRSHPSGAMHAMIASAVTSTLAAPVQVSLAGEGGVEMAGIHRSAVSVERMTDLGLDRSVGSWRAYVTGRIGKYKLDALPRLGETQANVQVLTLGANHRAGSQPVVGRRLKPRSL